MKSNLRSDRYPDGGKSVSASHGLECVFVSLTGDCRLSCPGCIFHDFSRDFIEPGRRGECDGIRPMPLDVFERLITEMRNMSVRKLKFGFGDEPLLHPDVARYAALAGESGLDVGVTTSARSLAGDVSRELLDAGVRSIIVSLNVTDYSSIISGGDNRWVLENLSGLLHARKDIACSGRRVPTRILVGVIARRGVAKDIERLIKFMEDREMLFDGVIVNAFLERAAPGGGIMTRNPRRPLGQRKPCMSPCKELYLMADGRTFPCVPAAVEHAFMKSNCGPARQALAGGRAETWNLGSWPAFSLQELLEKSRELRRIHEEERFDEVELCRQCTAWCQHYPKARKKNACVVEETSFWTLERIVRDETENNG